MPPPWQCSRPGWMELWTPWSGGRCPCSWQWGWNQEIFKVPSNPNHSMIQWFYVMARVPDHSSGEKRPTHAGQQSWQHWAPPQSVGLLSSALLSLPKKSMSGVWPLHLHLTPHLHRRRRSFSTALNPSCSLPAAGSPTLGPTVQSKLLQHSKPDLWTAETWAAQTPPSSRGD